MKDLGFSASEDLLVFLVQNDFKELADGLSGTKSKIDLFELNRIIKSKDIKRFNSIIKDIPDNMLNKAFLTSIGEGDENEINPIFYILIDEAKERRFIPSSSVMANSMANISLKDSMKIYDLGTEVDDSVARVAVLDINRLRFMDEINYKVQDVPMFAYDISFNENIQNIRKDKNGREINKILKRMTGMNVNELMKEANRIKKEREQEIEDMSQSIE